MRAEVSPTSTPSPAPAGTVEAGLDRTRRVAEHWSIRLRDLLSTYLPLLLMLLLAAMTWWLARVTPVPGAARQVEPPSQAPDYILGDVEFVRYRSDGSLMARIRAREVRHYPLGDRIELDSAWLMADHAEGALLAQAERAVLTDEGQRIRLQGDVRLSREATASQDAFVARTPLLEIDLQAGRAWTAEPVHWTQGPMEANAAGLDYEQAGSRLQLRGPLQAEIKPTGQRGR
jgi:lipopolysaccharide export system protein LptC